MVWRYFDGNKHALFRLSRWKRPNSLEQNTIDLEKHYDRIHRRHLQFLCLHID